MASRRKRIVERVVLGSLMAIAAAVIDRRVRRALRKAEVVRPRGTHAPTATLGPEEGRPPARR